jgi:hypothetical protein
LLSGIGKYWEDLSLAAHYWFLCSSHFQNETSTKLDLVKCEIHPSSRENFTVRLRGLLLLALVSSSFLASPASKNESFCSMQLIIDYEGEHYTTNLSTQLDDISLADVLGDRALLNCFISDRVCNTWSRVPCIEILRLFLKEYPAGETAQLRFQHEKHSPNTSPPLPPSKDAKDWSLPLDTCEMVLGQPIKDVVVIQSAPNGPKLSVRAESLLTDIKVAAESGTHAFSVAWWVSRPMAD